MIYFRCSVGGSGKGNTVTVTCAEEFAGLPITLAKIGKTYTKTCPSTAPYVVTFNGVENGTYTVSTTVEGQTYAETVIVQDISCVLNYGFNWKLWVDTASQLDSSDYASLSEVLADEKALRELFLEHACVDYMAESTSSNADLETIINDDYCAKWINNSDYALDFLGANTVIKALMDEADKYGYGEWALMPQVPKMTSNTAPYGEVIAISYASPSYYSWKAFDGTNTGDADSWAYQGNGANIAWIGYHFPTPVCVKKIYLENRNDNSVPRAIKKFKIQASNDGVEWLDISEEFTQISNVKAYGASFTFNNDIAYSYYRIFITDVYDTAYVGIGKLQFYAWAPKGNIPVMTANNAPYGEASASGYSGSGREPYRAFDDDPATGWTATASATNQYVTYKFTNPVCAKKVRLFLTYTGGTRPNRTFLIRASNDGTNFVNIGSCSVSGNNAVDNIIDCSTNEQYYLYYQAFCADIINVTNAWTWSVGVLQFYGRERWKQENSQYVPDYSEKEFEEGTTKKWLYDHGVNVGSVGVSSGAILDSDCAKLTVQWAQIYKESIDLTPYSLMRAKVGKVVNATSWVSVYSGNTSLAEKQIIANDMPNNIGLDVSTINQSVKVLSNISSAGETDITEWWLE